MQKPVEQAHDAKFSAGVGVAGLTLPYGDDVAGRGANVVADGVTYGAGVFGATVFGVSVIGDRVP
jgi:hypothetical protein